MKKLLGILALLFPLVAMGQDSTEKQNVSVEKNGGAIAGAVATDCTTNLASLATCSVVSGVATITFQNFAAGAFLAGSSTPGDPAALPTPRAITKGDFAGTGTDTFVLQLSSGVPTWASASQANFTSTVADNRALMGPSSGASAAPTFRLMTQADLANAGAVWQVCEDTSTHDTTAAQATETYMWSCSIPANALGTKGSVHVHIEGDLLANDTTSQNVTLKFKYGCADGTTAACSAGQVWLGGAQINSSTSLTTSSTRRPIVIDANLVANNATNSQSGAATFVMGAAVIGGTTTGAFIGGFDEANAPGATRDSLYPAVGTSNTTVDDTAASFMMITVTQSTCTTCANLSMRHLRSYAWISNGPGN